jgi:hypothetical protein
MSDMPETYAASIEAMHSTRTAPSVADELGPFLSARAAYDALEQAVHELGRIAGEDNDIMVKAFDITVREIVYIEPYALLFRGVNDDGQHAFVLCHFSQFVARFIFKPKGAAKREPIGFRINRAPR